MMLSSVQHMSIAKSLFSALRSVEALPSISEIYPDISIDDAYKISLAFLNLRISKNNEKVIGKKIGVTSKAVQDMLGVFQPDFGFLTDAMAVRDGRVNVNRLISPRAEAEIAFKLHADLKGPGITGERCFGCN